LLVLFVANDYARKGLDALLQAMNAYPAMSAWRWLAIPSRIPRYRELAGQLACRSGCISSARS